MSGKVNGKIRTPARSGKQDDALLPVLAGAAELGERHNFPALIHALEERDGKVQVGPPLPREATSYLPGSSEKIAVMMYRHSRKEQIFHPLDAGRNPLDGASFLQHLDLLVGANGSIPVFDRISREHEAQEPHEEEQDFLESPYDRGIPWRPKPNAR